MRTHNLTIEQQEALFNSQHGLCAICEKPLDKGKNTHVDHCHKTGRIRGLLCSECNFGLGKFEDDIDRLLRAIEYLRLYAESEELVS